MFHNTWEPEGTLKVKYVHSLDPQQYSIQKQNGLGRQIFQLLWCFIFGLRTETRKKLRYWEIPSSSFCHDGWKVNTNNIHTLGWRKAFLLLCHHSRKEISYLSTNTLGVTFIYDLRESLELLVQLSVSLAADLDFTGLQLNSCKILDLAFNLSVSMFESADFPCSWWVKLVFVFTLYQ